MATNQRCDNCGWSNPAGIERCQKCNQILTPSPVEESKVIAFNCTECGYPKLSASDVCPNCGAGGNPEADAAGTAIHAKDTKATIVFDTDTEELLQTPRIKGMPDSRSTTRDFGNASKNMKATVRDITGLIENNAPSAEPDKMESKEPAEVTEEGGNGIQETPAITFVPADGYIQYNEIKIDVNGPVILDRNKVDSNNPAIDEKGQASVYFEDGGWYIQNLSGNQNTFVCPKGKVKIESGDIVIVGNRRYIVK